MNLSHVDLILLGFRLSVLELAFDLLVKKTVALLYVLSGSCVDSELILHNHPYDIFGECCLGLHAFDFCSVAVFEMGAAQVQPWPSCHLINNILDKSLLL